MLNQAREEFRKANAIRQEFPHLTEENAIYEGIIVASKSAESFIEVHEVSDYMQTKLRSDGFVVEVECGITRGVYFVISGWTD